MTSVARFLAASLIALNSFHNDEPVHVLGTAPMHHVEIFALQLPGDRASGTAHLLAELFQWNRLDQSDFIVELLHVAILTRILDHLAQKAAIGSA